MYLVRVQGRMYITLSILYWCCVWIYDVQGTMYMYIVLYVLYLQYYVRVQGMYDVLEELLKLEL